MYFFWCTFLLFPLYESDDIISTFAYEWYVAIFLKMTLIISPESCKYSKPENREAAKYEAIEGHDAQYQSLCSSIFCSHFFSETEEMDEIHYWDVDNWRAFFLRFFSIIFLYFFVYV